MPKRASLAPSVESLDDLGALVGSCPSALSVLGGSSLVGSTLLSLSDEPSGDVSTLEQESALGSEPPDLDASDPLFTWGGDQLALSASSGESLDNGGLSVPADGLFELVLLPEGAFLSALFELSDDLSTSHGSSPLTLSPLVLASLVGDAVLSLSLPLLDNSSLDLALSALHVLSSCLGPESASSSVSEESSEDLRLAGPADGSLGVLGGLPDSASVGSLVELPDDLSTWEVSSP